MPLAMHFMGSGNVSVQKWKAQYVSKTRTNIHNILFPYSLSHFQEVLGSRPENPHRTVGNPTGQCGKPHGGTREFQKVTWALSLNNLGKSRNDGKYSGSNELFGMLNVSGSAVRSANECYF